MIKVGIDIGNSKISCVVCDLKKDQKPNILSFVSLPTNNISKNSFTNYNSLKNEILEVIQKSAKESQTEIKSINLNIPLSSSISYYYESNINIENEPINDLHLKKALNQSNFFDNILNYEILMNYIINYELDNKTVLISPLGNFANNLNLNFYKLVVDQNMINTYKNLFSDINIHIANFIPNVLSSSLSTLTDDDKQLGSICIDIGSSSTSLALFENNKLLFCDSINVGSKNITNDIARGLSTDLDSAERLKTLYGSVLTTPSDEFEIIEVPLVSSENKQFKQVNRSAINSIIKPRVEETLELVWQKLKQYNFHKKKIKNVVLTGGGSQLEGIGEYAEIIFDSNVRLGKPIGLLGLNRKYSGPQFSQTIGSIFFKETDYSLNFIEKSKNIANNGILGRFSSWLDKYI